MLAVAGAAPGALSQASPSAIAEHQLAARQAEARDDFATAIEEYRLLTTWLPDNGQVWSNLGVALYGRDSNGFITAARRFWASFQALWPD